MPESDASHNEPQGPPTEEAWRDKILGDAMGYTKGLVTVLDSLNEGFRRRGQEIEELRHHLTILQNERRTIQEQRSGFEVQIGALTAERDKLRSSLEERNREFDQLRQELLQSQAALEARNREIQEIRAVDHNATRQAEELREIVRDMERERVRLRESTAQTQREEAALRDSLARTEQLLESARRDLADSQKEVARLQGALRGESDSSTADRKSLSLTLEERSRELDQLRQELSQKQEALETRAQEIQDLQAARANAVREEEELREAIRELEGAREGDALQHATRLAEVERLLQEAHGSSAQAQREEAALRDSLARTEQLLDSARRDLAHSQEQIASLRSSLEREQSRAEYLQDQLRTRWQDLPDLNTTVRTARGYLRDIAVIVGGPLELGGGGETAQEEVLWAELVQRVRLHVEAAARAQEELVTLRRLAEPVREEQGTKEALPERPHEIPPPLTGPSMSQRGSKHRDPLVGVLVECMLEGSGGQATRILRGEMTRLNSMGLMGVFDERLPEGRRVVIRLTRGQEVLSCHGRVLRVRPSATVSDGVAVFDHLIRFDSPMQDFHR
ncbi:MAG TPA: hypothetical protein VEH53_08225 [archaeon]|nr:hypothetical protein [archaeon]